MLDRRRFLGSSAAALSFVFARESRAEQPVGIRKSAKALSAGEWDSFERGVAAMKRLPKDDPRSWEFQANMHGIVRERETVIYQGWATCQHGNWWFLPWHRAYLFYFEEILRAFSGDPGFMLPYWDWTDPGQRSIPERFLDPNSPLFDGSRDQLMAGGGVLPPDVVDWEYALSETIFSTPVPGHGFGGPSEPVPSRPGPHGALESHAHDGVHDQIGGNMGDPRTAGNDPIFWLHHANVDRLWGRWLAQGGGRQDPSDASWLDQPFWFYGPRGVGGTLTARSVLSTEQLGYRYDTDQASGMLLAQAEARPPKGPAPRAVVMPAPRPAAPVVLGVRMPPRAALGPEPLSVTFKLDAEPKKHVERVFAAAPRPGEMAAPDAPRVQVAIEDIKFEKSPGRNYAVYINLPGPADATGPKSPYYAGLLSFFALHTHDEPAHAMAGMAGGKTAVIDVTDAVNRLKGMGKIQDEIKVTLVEVKAKPGRKPRAVAAAPGVAPPAPPPPVTIGAIRLLKTGE